ncbi:MAG: hypothetical protein JWM53_90, partial [bacterium]|nr:hypothetical protein [bacterium]
MADAEPERRGRADERVEDLPDVASTRVLDDREIEAATAAMMQRQLGGEHGAEGSRRHHPYPVEGGRQRVRAMQRAAAELLEDEQILGGERARRRVEQADGADGDAARQDRHTDERADAVLLHPLAGERVRPCIGDHERRSTGEHAARIERMTVEDGARSDGAALADAADAQVTAVDERERGRAEAEIVGDPLCEGLHVRGHLRRVEVDVTQRDRRRRRRPLACPVDALLLLRQRVFAEADPLQRLGDGGQQILALERLGQEPEGAEA